MANLGEKLIGAGLGYKAAKDQMKAAEAAAAKRRKIVESLDFNPMTTAELAPTYKRTESPVARGWIESFLMGNNPAAINPTSPNAARLKRDAQFAQNAMFGTPEQRVARQRQIEQETPWAVTPPTRTIGRPPEERAKAEYHSQFVNPDKAEKYGLTPELDAAMKAANPKWEKHNTALQGAYLTKKFGSAAAAIEAIQRGDKDALKYVNHIPFGS